VPANEKKTIYHSRLAGSPASEIYDPVRFYRATVWTERLKRLEVLPNSSHRLKDRDRGEPLNPSWLHGRNPRTGGSRFWLWELPDPMTRLFDNHNGSSFQSISAFGNNVREAIYHVGCSRIPQAKENDSGLTSFSKRYDLAEIQIKGHDDARLSDGLFEDSTVRRPLKSFIP
jgi:hypothetical protein